MKIIEPKVELWQQGNNAKAHIARCARVCYGRTSGNDSFNKYKLLVDIGMHRQDARGVLPLDTATRCLPFCL